MTKGSYLERSVDKYDTYLGVNLNLDILPDWSNTIK